MLKRGKIIWASILIGTLGATLVSCNNQGPSEETKAVEIKITSTKTSVDVGSTLQLSAEVKNAENTKVRWSSSDTKVATIGEETGLLTALAKGKTTITVTSVADSTKTATVEITVNEVIPVEISLTATTTELEVGDTLQLTSEVQNTEDKTVSWESSDTTVASVNQTGLVTALAKGKTTITVTSVADSTKKASVEINVSDYRPTSVVITGYTETSLLSHSTLQLGVDVAPSDAVQTVTWSTSNEDIATVSDTGLVSFVGEGEVKISATSTKNTAIKDEVTFNPYYIVSTFWGNESWDFTGLHGMEPTFKSKNNTINQNAVLNNVSGKYYAFEATAKITDPSDADVWSRVGLGHIPTDNGGRVHAFMVSPGIGFNQRKTVVMDIVNGSVQWGTITDRSQVWWQHDQAKFDYNNIKIGAVRNGNDYYYYINGELYWVEKGYSDFADNDTFPAFHCGNTNVEFSKISVVTGEEEVRNYLESNATTTDLFYASYSENVKIDRAEKSIKFINCENNITTNIKDQAAKDIGNAVWIKDKVNTKVDFDLTVDQFGSRDSTPALVVTLGRYDSAAAESRSAVIGENAASFAGWNSNNDIPGGFPGGVNNYTSALTEGETYHVTFYKLSSEEKGTDVRVIVNGIDITHNWDDGYHGTHTLWFGARDMNATIKNITITEE